jgi:hypothetical protein
MACCMVTSPFTSCSIADRILADVRAFIDEARAEG